jgi:hypothetical protein
MGFDNLNLANTIAYPTLFTHIQEYHLDIKYKKPLIDGLIINVGTTEERISREEILIYCDDICSLGHWTQEGIEVIRNYV